MSIKLSANLLFLKSEYYIFTHRKIAPIKWMDDKGLIAEVDDTRNLYDDQSLLNVDFSFGMFSSLFIIVCLF